MTLTDWKALVDYVALWVFGFYAAIFVINLVVSWMVDD